MTNEMTLTVATLKLPPREQKAAELKRQFGETSTLSDAIFLEMADEWFWLQRPEPRSPSTWD